MSKVKHSAFKYDFLGSDPKDIQRSVSNHLVYTIGKDPYTATDHDWMMAFSHVIRDRLIERWMETQRNYYRHDAKRLLPVDGVPHRTQPDQQPVEYGHS
jgi:starch phosphorylase